MKRKRLASLLCLVLLGAAAGGCAVADTGAFVRLQEDMEALKKQVAAGPRSTAGPAPASAAAGQDELASFRRSLADLASDSDRMKSDLLALGARTDETKLEMKKEASRLNGITTEQGQAIQEMRRKIAKPEEKAGKGGGAAGP